MLDGGADFFFFYLILHFDCYSFSVLPMLDGGADLFLISEFVKVHISVTVMVVLIFGSKVIP